MTQPEHHLAASQRRAPAPVIHVCHSRCRALGHPWRSSSSRQPARGTAYNPQERGEGMKATHCCAAVLFGTSLLLVQTSFAQTVIEQAAEHRLQLDFRVNDAALAKMLPNGWETVIATQGPAKDCNLRMIFIDRMAIMGADGKPAPRA